MKLLKLLLLGTALVAGHAMADGALPQRAAPHPALYSFVDVYRLTVAGPMGVTAAETAAEVPIRVAAPQAQAAAEPRFSVSAARAARQVAAAARRPRARRLGGASPPGAFALMKRLLLLALFMVPAGCERAAADRPAAQLVAKVNGTEISVQQVRTAGSAASPASVAQALEKVIDRELLVQKALAAKLDRDPQVQQSIESARRQVLAQAYLERSRVARPAAARATKCAPSIARTRRCSPSAASTACASWWCRRPPR